MQVAQITSKDKDMTISTLLEQGSVSTVNTNDFANEHVNLATANNYNYFI